MASEKMPNENEWFAVVKKTKHTHFWFFLMGAVLELCVKLAR